MSSTSESSNQSLEMWNPIGKQQFAILEALYKLTSARNFLVNLEKAINNPNGPDATTMMNKITPIIQLGNNNLVKPRIRESYDGSIESMDSIESIDSSYTE